MHKLLLTFLGFVIFSLNTYSQDKIEIKTFEEKTHYDSLEINTFYFIDETLFQSIQQNNEKEFKLAYIWEIWCKSCVKGYPLVLKLTNDYKSIDAFLIINDSREKYLKRVVKFFEKKGYPDVPLFILKNEQRSYDANYDKFVKTFFPQHNDHGLSLFMLFDKNNTPIYSTNATMEIYSSIDSVENRINHYKLEE